MKITITILFLFLVKIGYAQMENATIYFKDGKQISGLAKISNSDINSKMVIRFRKEKKSQKETFDYTTVKSIQFTDEWNKLEYHYKIPEGHKTPMLLEAIIYGRISLYTNRRVRNSPKSSSTINDYSSNIIDYYVSKHNSFDVYLLSTSNFSKKKFNNSVTFFFQKCPQLVKKVNNKDFTKYNIEKIIKFYNSNCSEN